MDILSQETLLKLLENALAYTPIVYNQATYNISEDAKGYNYTIEYKMPSFPEDCLLFVVPEYSSKEATQSAKPTLYIKTPTTKNGKTEYLQSLEYEIIVETLEDAVPYRQATVGDIISNRMCIFRFKRGYNKAILVNSPLFNDARYTSILATNAEFSSRPIITTEVDQDGNETQSRAATLTDVSNLSDRLSDWENKITFGTEAPEVALAEAKVGTIYIQLEED